MNFKFDTSGLSKGIDAFGQKANDALRMYAEASALKLERYARKNAPWTNRTGDARKTLSTEVSRTAEGYKIKLAHGVDYGIWLELANEKNYAIVEPTIRLNSKEVIQGMKRLLERF